MSAIAEEKSLPAENLITPDLVRRVCWEPPAVADAENIAAALRRLGARRWQTDLVAPALADAFDRAAS